MQSSLSTFATAPNEVQDLKFPYPGTAHAHPNGKARQSRHSGFGAKWHVAGIMTEVEIQGRRSWLWGAHLLLQGQRTRRVV